MLAEGARKVSGNFTELVTLETVESSEELFPCRTAEKASQAGGAVQKGSEA